MVMSGLLSYLNGLCLKHGSTFQGRMESIKYLSKRNRLVPLFVSPTVVLLFTKGIRHQDTVLINYIEILSYQEVGKDQTKIIFKDLVEVVMDVSMKKFHVQYELAHTFFSRII